LNFDRFQLPYSLNTLHSCWTFKIQSRQLRSYWSWLEKSSHQRQWASNLHNW